ncbi:hypothetical protein O7606_15920 [Micromonospora sp. WMMD882]|uniref:hypothetical protein n=1 Tax=Micromonospora sp. WMMD882 TaxID=3015151 RepID=UPI00248D299B|nr:hypothetical protein [Micromonospora sp. WMMD882]WBB77757.1 hypothetical protein O7606_15920 [Micromonospora sp. WMMD882]
MSALIQQLATESDLLARHGLTVEEYRDALPAAVEAARGSMSASNSDRRQFLLSVLEALQEAGLAQSVTKPQYGDDTVYRLSVAGIGNVAIIQKGCPDGAHSSVRWSVPDWAQETYLWWLCPSLNAEPGEHIAKGSNRLRGRFFDAAAPGTLDGVIFHNDLCGTSRRRCPKEAHAIQIGAHLVPPPCIYVMPDRQPTTSQASGAAEWNWDGRTQRLFPGILLSLFGISEQTLPTYVGHVGFQRKGGTVRTTISARFGLGRSATYRS